MKYIIGTRGSKLALAQTESVCRRLRENYPEHEFEIQIIRTKGDRILHKPLHQIGDKGLFVGEIEEKIQSGEIHMGVHSMKDMPAEPAQGLVFTKAWNREDSRDVLILREVGSLDELPAGAVIATGSIRREAQLKRIRPDICVTGIRGNVDTRLRKMEEEKLDGIVLAAAGLHRLGLQERITQYLEPEQVVPSPAQGTLALEVRKEDWKLRQMLDRLSDPETDRMVRAERLFLKCTGGDCHMPVGAYCTKKEEGKYSFYGMFGNSSQRKMETVMVEGREPEELAREAFSLIRSRMAGKVFLVGAGPGDTGLITVKGLETVRKADCIIYDRLSAPELLDESKADCERIYVGKENHNHTMKQEEINRLLVKKATEYETVVRLKGGDVYVFGRGGEEGMFLYENGIPFEVVPGVSSCTAGLAYAGIPVTHRGVAGGFHVVTAHDRNDQLAEMDFEGMARSRETCVFLMGLNKLPEIVRGLLEAGMVPETEAAVISKATTSEQKMCVAQLGNLAEKVKKSEMDSPALIVVGDVVGLREPLDFFSRKPLTGKRYLIPGIGEKTSRLTNILREQGAYVREEKLGQIVPCEINLEKKELFGIDWFLFTSQNGVEVFWTNLMNSGLDVRCVAAAKFAAVGKKTAAALKNRGICPDFIPGCHTGKGLAEELKILLSGKEKVCYVKAETTEEELEKELEDVCCLERMVVYCNKALENPDFDPATISGYNGVLCTCASLAKRFSALCGGEWQNICRNQTFYSIGPRTTETLKKLGARRVMEAVETSYEALADLVIQTEREGKA